MLAKRFRIWIKDGLRFLRSKAPRALCHSSRWRREYDRFSALLASSASKSPEELRADQNKRLRELIAYAYENVPYYRQLFDEKGLDPAKVQGIEDLACLPFLTKDIIRREGDRMLSRAIPKEEMVIHETGGSSGKPVKFYFEKDLDDAREAAFVDHIYSRIGYDKRERTVTFAIFDDSRFLREAEAAGYGRVGKKYPGKPLWIFSYALVATRAEDYAEELKWVDPLWMKGMPSALYHLTRALQDKGIPNPMPHLKGLILNSEMLYPHQKALLESYYGVPILHFYGHTEHACVAGTCEKGLRFHLQPEYGIAEFIPFEGEKKELIATGLHNRAMPLIRYQTRDLFTLSDTPCSCGRPYQMIDSIEGRATDLLYLKNGAVVSDVFCDFATLPNSWLSRVSMFQIEQREKGKCLLKLVPAEGETLSPKALAEIQKSVETYFFDQMDVEAVVVDSIPKTGRGKEKLILSLVKEEGKEETP